MRLTASAERYSEHPLAKAVCSAAKRQIELARPQSFSALPGLGVRALVEGRQVEVGSQRLLAGGAASAAADGLIAAGKTLLVVQVGGEIAGLLAAADTLRPEAPQAIAALQAMGLKPSNC